MSVRKPGGHTKIRVTRLEDGNAVYTYSFLLNPTNIYRERVANWVDHYAPGTMEGIAQFVNTPGQDITFKFMIAKFSSANEGSLDPGFGANTLSHIAEVESWVIPSLDGMLEDQFNYVSPPQLVIAVGSRAWLCTARSVTIDERLHDNNYDPLIVDVTVKFKTHSNSFETLAADMQKLRNQRGTL